MHLTLPFAVTACALVMISAAFAADGWQCGNLFSANCDSEAAERGTQTAFRAGKWLLVVSAALVLCALVLEVVVCQKEVMERRSPLNFFRCFFLAVVFCCLLAGTVLMTHALGDIYSYFCVVLCFGFVMHANQIIFGSIGCFGSNPDPLLNASY